MKMPLHLAFATGIDPSASSRRLRNGHIWAAPSRVILCVLLLGAGLAAGCKKKEAAAAPATGTSPEEAAAPASPRGAPAMAPPSDTPVVIAPADNSNEVLSQLTAELRKYVIHTRSVPKNFEEFIAKSLVQPPAAPAGQKYAIKNHAVVLVAR
jgi:hypothetical protein